MSDQAAGPVRCEGCAFWRKLREHEGLCARHAPEASVDADEAAHWPQTHGWQGCGEGVAAQPMSVGAHCADCVFWHRPRDGLHPVDRGDMPVAWWARAGLCVRHAPYPVPEPGPRAFWRATQDTDFCADGLSRNPGESPRAART